MRPIGAFNVAPALPPRLEPLRRIAYNLWWAWNHDAIELFRRLDSELWETTGHNPVLMLGSISQAQLEAAAHDEAFLAHVERVARDLETYLAGEGSWFRRVYGKADSLSVAYFSAEFGLTECLSIFAGGLGVLAGDHLKSASDLGVPVVGVGLLYQQGYFKQYLNESGWQQEAYEDNDFHNLPIQLLRGPDGNPVLVALEFPGRTVCAQLWQAHVGRVSLILLDTNIPANPNPEDRDITDQLYGGDSEMRIRQEIVLGMGGYRALEALGFDPTVYHMNEGHSAFLALEHVRRLMQRHRLSFEEARQLASPSLIFTTHTPVEAGHDFFPPELMDRYFSGYYPQLGLSRDEFLGLGRRNPHDASESFCMTILALRLAAFSNGVSRLHGEVTRRMWGGIWPGVPESEVPIGHVTNGVHFRSWISYEMNQLYDRYLGPAWREEPADPALWRRAETIPAEELWRTHERRRERLVAFARRRLRQQLERRGAPRAEIEAADEALDPEALTIGFARRFATYKRATLILRDVERLKRILNDPARPVQVIFAGKAHPRDGAGKELIRQIVALARQPDFRRRLVFLEDHDMAVARYLVQGCDVWLNTPLRPLEASGTSGMKAAANGALNLSTLDGWWDEAWSRYNHRIGWAIGRGETYDQREYQDMVEAEALYDVLERDVVPTFYERGRDRLPRRWIERMRTSIASLCHFFNTHRMVREYTERFYLVCNALYRTLADNGAARARALAAWLARVRSAWHEVRVEAVERGLADLLVGQRAQVRVRVHLGPLLPDDVRVELYLGKLDSDGRIVDPVTARLEPTGERSGNSWIFEGGIAPCTRSGRHGYTIRILPSHPDLISPFLPNLITWAS
ncbi:MAG: alpha-glucan family phosphorylase [Bryobacterales bacterium]|nr:alpha-glucan family phosphorylase [Bryobacteraceae bacterium]MDW8129004.1 alpha-glucan family phosphorylase [Bryobacterales bacterium]